MKHITTRNLPRKIHEIQIFSPKQIPPYFIKFTMPLSFRSLHYATLKEKKKYQLNSDTMLSYHLEFFFSIWKKVFETYLVIEFHYISRRVMEFHYISQCILAITITFGFNAESY